MPPRKSAVLDISSAIAQMKQKYPNYITGKKYPTGIYPMDYVLSGGYVKGAMYEFASDPSVGKSTCLLHTAKNLIKMGERIIYLNIENAPMDDLLHNMGMDTLPDDQFLFLTPTLISEIEEVLDKIALTTPLYEEPKYNHIIFDSIGAMLPDMLVDRSSADMTIGAKARQQGDFFTRYMPQIKRRLITTWWVNHVSMHIDTSFGGQSKKDSKGGNTFLYYMDVRLFATTGERLFRKTQTLTKKDDKSYYANISKLTTLKNKTGGNPYIVAPFPVFYGKGISNPYFIYEILNTNGYATTVGAWIKISILDKDEPNKQGVQGALEYIRDNQKAIITKLREDKLWFN